MLKGLAVCAHTHTYTTDKAFPFQIYFNLIDVTHLPLITVIIYQPHDLNHNHLLV